MSERFFSYHIFWKEYRQMRAFWLSVLVVAATLQLIVYTTSAFTQTEPLYALAVCFAALYAMGCGATAFALEQENGTYDFLRALPTRAPATFFSKVAFTLVSAPLLFVAMCLTAGVVSSFVLPDALGYVQLLATWGFISLVLFIWAIFFSLLLQSAVRAALLGGLAACLAAGMVAWFCTDFLEIRDERYLFAAQGAVVCVVAGLDVLLGFRWYHESHSGRLLYGDARSATSFAELERQPPQKGAFGHLLWLQWQQSRGTILILTAMLVPFAMNLLLFGVAESRDFLGAYQWLRWIFGPLFALGILAAAVVVPLAGANVFAGDQTQQRFRFLTDRGASPKSVWWSRQVVWMATVAIWVAGLLVPLALLAAGHMFFGSWEPDYVAWKLLLPAFLCIPLVYCLGQLCSMLFRSGILAGSLTLASSLLLCQWTFAMALLDVPLIWSVVPIPIFLLVATRLRTRGWLLESNAARDWLPMALVLVVPSVVILVGVGLRRAYQYPFVEPGFNVAVFTTPAPPEAQETAKTYLRAHALLPPTPPGANLGLASTDVEDGDMERAAQPPDPAVQEAVAIVLENSQRPNCGALSEHAGESAAVEVPKELAVAVIREGKRLEQEGDLEAAMNHYLAALRMAHQMYPHSRRPIAVIEAERMTLSYLARWSTRSGQTSARIVGAIRTVEELTEQPVPVDNLIKGMYVRLRDIFNGDMDDMFEWMGPRPSEASATLLIYWMPWERERARRLLRLTTATDLERVARAKTAVEVGLPAPIPGFFTPEEPPSWIEMTPDAWVTRYNYSWVADNVVSAELARRTTLLKMALVARQLDHASLPDSLEELEGDYLTEVPLDPYSGEPFVYFPEGLDSALKIYDEVSRRATVVIEAGTPFFWSSGPSIAVERRDLPPMQKYSIRESSVSTRRVATPEQIWAAGRIISVPAVEGKSP